MTGTTNTTISEARLTANQANAKKSHGPLTDATKAISSQNHTIHGLTRHKNGHFKVLWPENSDAFEALKQSLFDEHQPATPTESILVNRMLESQWLADRAQRLQQTCTESATGAVTDEKKFSLYVRYETTHTRAFHKCLNDLYKLRAEKRKAEFGVEAQRAKTAKENRENERHEMKKVTHGIETFQKDVTAHNDLAKLIALTEQYSKDIPGFDDRFARKVAQHGLDKEWWEVKSQAA